MDSGRCVQSDQHEWMHRCDAPHDWGEATASAFNIRLNKNEPQGLSIKKRLNSLGAAMIHYNVQRYWTGSVVGWKWRYTCGMGASISSNKSPSHLQSFSSKCFKSLNLSKQHPKQQLMTDRMWFGLGLAASLETIIGETETMTAQVPECFSSWSLQLRGSGDHSALVQTDVQLLPAERRWKMFWHSRFPVEGSKSF